MLGLHRLCWCANLKWPRQQEAGFERRRRRRVKRPFVLADIGLTHTTERSPERLIGFRFSIQDASKQRSDCGRKEELENTKKNVDKNRVHASKLRRKFLFS